jgi:Plasmid pRiA4b ORF-3-like protein
MASNNPAAVRDRDYVEVFDDVAARLGRACPSEDCGGPYGYEDFVAKLQDEKHPEHPELISWVGGLFDPEGFDLNRTNQALRSRFG